METLPALRFCAEVIAEREATDREHRWLWTIRRQVLDWSLSTLERQQENTVGSGDPPSGGFPVIELTADEKQSLLSTHPLLRPAAIPALPAYRPAAAWYQTLSRRVRRLLKRRQEEC